MPSITLSISNELKNELKHFSWVNWSETAREELLKKEIFENFMKKKRVTNEDLKFCEKINWHPVDDLPLRKDFIKKLKTQKTKSKNPMPLKEFNKWCEDL